MIEQLIQGAAAGSWPAAFVLAAMCASLAATVVGLIWGFAKMVETSP